MAYVRWCVAATAVFLGACSARNPAFEPDTGGPGDETEAEADGVFDEGMEAEAGDETEAGDEGEEGRCDGEPPVEFNLSVVRSTFIRRDTAPDCTPFGVDFAFPELCELLDFGGFREHPIYGARSDEPLNWDSEPNASHLLVEFNDDALRPSNGEEPGFDDFEGMLSIPLLGDGPPADGELIVLLMEFGQDHEWFPGMMEGGAATPGTSVFAFRRLATDSWVMDEPLRDAFGSALIVEPIEDVSPNEFTYIEAEVNAERLKGFFLEPSARQNGMLITTTALAPGVVVDSGGIELLVSACPR